MFLSRLASRVGSSLYSMGCTLTSTASAAGKKNLESALNSPYSRPLQLLHWAMGAGIVTCIATVKLQQWSKDNDFKGKMMHIHKSTALLVLGMIPLRIFYGLKSKTPALPGPMGFISKLSHFGLYALMIGMPISGVVMGYFGGKGLPFFNWHISGASDEDKKPAIAKKAYQLHKKAGLVLEGLTLLHIGGAAFHLALGQNLFRRMGFGLASFGVFYSGDMTDGSNSNDEGEYFM
eukprot:m.91513 g.91513  ORF g.91513 m.91513 type:complete len:234 (+) comp8873_c5_seq1:109-810(+)